MKDELEQQKEFIFRKLEAEEMARRREKEWQENLRNELEFEEREVQAQERVRAEKKRKQQMRE